MKKTFSKIKITAAVLLLSLATAPATIGWAQAPGATQKEAPLVQAEQMPAFEGGEAALMKYLATNIKYPKEAAKAGKSGMVVLQFVVEKDGTLGDLKVLKSAGTELDQEAERVVKSMSGKWSPGKQNGEVRRVQMTLPIRFETNPPAPDATGQLPARPAPAPEAPGTHIRSAGNPILAAAQYKGGQEALKQAIHQNLRVPVEARKEHLNAQVVAHFVVEKDGTISNINLQKTRFKKTVGLGSELDYMDAGTFGLQNKTLVAQLNEATALALRNTNGNWEPGSVDGEKVRVEMSLPITYLSTDPPKSEVGAPTLVLQEAPVKPKAKPDPNKAYTYVEQMPVFKGGEEAMMAFLAANTRYPEAAKEAGTEGLVVLSFVVQKNGSLTGIKVLKSLGHGTDEEAVRVVQSMSGKWEAGKQNGVPVDVQYTLPMRFAMHPKPKLLQSKPVEVKPTFREGKEAMLKHFAKNLRYPAATQAEGTALVQFEVEQDGSLGTVSIVNSVDALVDAELLRVVQESQGLWQPAQNKGEAVKTLHTLSVRYKILGPGEKAPVKGIAGETADVLVVKYK